MTHTKDSTDLSHAISVYTELNDFDKRKFDKWHREIIDLRKQIKKIVKEATE